MGIRGPQQKEFRDLLRSVLPENLVGWSLETHSKAQPSLSGKYDFIERLNSP